MKTERDNPGLRARNLKIAKRERKALHARLALRRMLGDVLIEKATWGWGHHVTIGGVTFALRFRGASIKVVEVRRAGKARGYFTAEELGQVFLLLRTLSLAPVKPRIPGKKKTTRQDLRDALDTQPVLFGARPWFGSKMPRA